MHRALHSPAPCRRSAVTSLCRFARQHPILWDQRLCGRGVLYGNNFSETIEKVSEVAEMEWWIFIPAYDEPRVITGQGTIGLAILENLYDADNVIVAVALL